MGLSPDPAQRSCPHPARRPPNCRSPRLGWKSGGPRMSAPKGLSYALARRSYPQPNVGTSRGEVNSHLLTLSSARTDGSSWISCYGQRRIGDVLVGVAGGGRAVGPDVVGVDGP